MTEGTSVVPSDILTANDKLEIKLYVNHEPPKEHIEKIIRLLDDLRAVKPSDDLSHRNCVLMFLCWRFYLEDRLGHSYPLSIDI